MEAQHLHRGRLVDHVQLVVRDLAVSRRFYAAVLDALGVPIGARGRGSSGPTSCSSPPPTAWRRRAD